MDVQEPSEDSNDVEMSEDLLPSSLKSFNALSAVSSSSGLGLSSLLSSTTAVSSNFSLVGSSSSSSMNSSSVRGKPFGIARRGHGSSLLFPRMRGGISSKYTSGKKGGAMSRKRGTATLAPARKGRGANSGGAGRGYRGYFNYQPITLQVSIFLDMMIISYLQNFLFQSMDTQQSAGKEEGEENKLILLNAKDQYSIWQDVCAMCGAFGQDQEARLIACSQCGQCYHPYCANVKVNKVVLEKGWRCLDCTVCEGCGERNDEGRLVLCEDCDISCHIYCMTPPLESVPAGIWKCKWYV